MAELNERFINSSNATTLVSEIKKKSDASYIAKTDETIAKKTDITITGIPVNGSPVTPVDKVVDISVITSDDVASQITTAIGNIKEFNIEVVSVLPTENISKNTIYLVPNGESGSNNIYDEYIYITTEENRDPHWEVIGTKAINLSGYAKISDLSNYVEKVSGKGLSANDFTNEYKSKLDGIEEGAQVNTVTSVAGRTGAVILGISDVAELENSLASKVSKGDVLTEAEIETIVNNAWV